MTQPAGRAPREAILTGAVGGLLGGATAGLLSGPGGAAVGAVIGGANGVLSGRRRIYDWSSRRGIAAFGLDSTWSLANTGAGLAAHLLGAVRGNPGFDRRLSERHNRHVYRRGFQPRRGFAVSLGNVINGGGDLDQPRRAKLVTDHENVHVWQARLFGPAYPVLYVGWMAGGAIVGSLLWLTGRRREPLGRVVESCAYYLNPFEWWAYSRDDHWPPAGKIAGLGWRRPIVRSFAARA